MSKYVRNICVYTMHGFVKFSRNLLKVINFNIDEIDGF